MNDKKKISIIGGTGNLGVPVVKFLLKSGFEIKLIARNTNKAKRLFETNPKLKIIEADLGNVPELKTALSDTVVKAGFGHEIWLRLSRKRGIKSP